MESETTPTTHTMRLQPSNVRIEVNEFLPAENFRRKERFRKAIKRMLTISSHYLRAGQTNEAISAQLVHMPIVQRATERNETDQGHCSGICRKCPCSEF